MIIDKGKKVKTREKSTLKARASLPIKEAIWRERRSSVQSLTITLSRILSRRSILQHYLTSRSSPPPWSLDVQESAGEVISPPFQPVIVAV